MTKTRARDAIPLLAILVAATALVLASQRWLPFVGGAETFVSDLRMVALAPQAPQSKDVVIIAITEATLASFAYRSPIDRGFMAGLIETLDASGAAAIGIDVLFDQPTEADKDAALAAALAAAETPIVAIGGDSRDGLTAAQTAYVEDMLAAVDDGFAALPRDAYDGIVRRYTPRRPGVGGDQPSFAAALAAALGREAPERPFALAYRGPPGDGSAPFATYPAEAVGLLPQPWLAGKVALIGADLPHSDRLRTPFSAGGGADMAGVVVHAHALDQILSGRRHPAAGRALAAAIVLLAAAVGIASAAAAISWLASLAMVTGALAAIWAGGFALYAAGGAMLPVVTPTLALSLAAGLTSAFRRRGHGEEGS